MELEGNLKRTRKELKGNSQGTQRKRERNSKRTQKELEENSGGNSNETQKGNSKGTQRELKGNLKGKGHRVHFVVHMAVMVRCMYYIITLQQGCCDDALSSSGLYSDCKPAAVLASSQMFGLL